MSEEQKEYAIDYIMQLQEENYKLKQENKQLKEINNKVKELVKNYEELEKVSGAGKPRFPLYKLQEILGGKDGETN